jgi:hypothetical protein
MRKEKPMVSKHKRWLLLAVMSAFLFGASGAHADLYWESEQVTKGAPGQADGTRIVKNYYTSRASRIETGDCKVMIMDLDKMTMVHLNPADKTYTESNMEEFGGPRNMPGMDKAQQKKMMESMMQSMQVTPTNETKTINGYKCRKHMVSVMMVNSEYWLSKDVKGYEELKAIGAKMAKSFEKNPMLKQMNIAGMMDKLDGFPVQTVSQVMRGTITNTLVKIEKKSLGDDLFKVPAGYTMKKMQGMQ